MPTQRIAASSYSNTAPLVWSFLYGSQRENIELFLDAAPARSAELLFDRRINAALVPIIVSQQFDDVRIIPNVCVGAEEFVQSVCLITDGKPLQNVKSVALDISSKTSVALTKIIFREFLGFNPIWNDAKPNLEEMLSTNDCALLIGDPALSVPDTSQSSYKKYDLVELWRSYTNFGFIFAMWMTKGNSCTIDFEAARDEGTDHIDEIINTYKSQIPLPYDEYKNYLIRDISYKPSESMLSGMKLFFELAETHEII